MATNQSTKSKSTGSSNDFESVNKEDEKRCFCGRRARVCTSWTLKNQGRRFYTCSTPKEGHGCHYFEWFQKELCPRSLEVVSHMNQRRIYLEEKLKLVEENLAEKTKKKKALKSKMRVLLEQNLRHENEKKKMRTQVKMMYVFVVVMLMTLMFGFK